MVDENLDVESDEELLFNKQNKKLFKHEMNNAMVDNTSDEPEYDSNEFRSIGSSSEDENFKFGNVGPPAINKKRRGVVSVSNFKKNEMIRWKAGMSFVSMTEFRTIVREYGIRRGGLCTCNNWWRKMPSKV